MVRSIVRGGGVGKLITGLLAFANSSAAVGGSSFLGSDCLRDTVGGDSGRKSSFPFFAAFESLVFSSPLA